MKLTPTKREILQTAKGGPLFRNISGYSRAGTRRFATAPVRDLVGAGLLVEKPARTSGVLMVFLTDEGRAVIGSASPAPPTADDRSALSLHDRIAP